MPISAPAPAASVLERAIISRMPAAVAQMLDADRDQLRTPEGAGEADQQQRPIPATGKIVAAHLDGPFDLRSGKGADRRPGSPLQACDAAQRLSDCRCLVSSGCKAIRRARAMAATLRRSVGMA